MSVDHGSIEALPEAVRTRVVALAAGMYGCIMSEGLSAAQAEERVTELSREVGRTVLSAGLSEAYGRQSGTWRPCERGGLQRFIG